jgi:PAS domain S-box-containing protein
MTDTIEKLQAQLAALQKEAEENEKSFAQLQTEQLFSEKVLDSLPGIFYLYDENGNLVRWNKNHEILTGFTAEELPKRKMLDWFSDKEKKKVAAEVNKLFETGTRRDIEADLIVKSGQKIPYYFTGVRMIVEGKIYLLGVGIDLTEQKKTEEELRKSEEKYRTIFENAVEGIYQTTPGGQIISANPSMAAILGYASPEELVQTIQDISNELYVSKIDRDEFIRLLSENKTVSGFEAQFFKKDKSRIWVSIHARPVFDARGQLSLIEGMIVDITKQKIAAEELRNREEYLRKENIRLRSNIKDRYRFGDIIGKSKPMQEVYELILKASATDANVIIYGESGTGKELVANAIHNLSDRNSGQFVPVNCGAIPETLLESEFFGYKKGAFTGAHADKKGFLEVADNGTLFLDELGEIVPNLQVKLLRVLEGKGFTPIGSTKNKKPDIRIIAATNRNLQRNVSDGSMREDFFYRIHIIPITLPPLRERKEDIPLLIEHFIKAEGKERSLPLITGEMIEAMLRYNWPGNVRELQNVLQRFVTLNQFDLMKETETADFDIKMFAPLPADAKEINYQKLIDQFERNLIEHSLQQNQWQREVSAKSLGLSLRTFYRKLKRHGLVRQK